MLATMDSCLLAGMEGSSFPQRRLTVNLAPPEMRKEGSSLDVSRQLVRPNHTDQRREIPLS